MFASIFALFFLYIFVFVVSLSGKFYYFTLLLKNNTFLENDWYIDSQTEIMDATTLNYLESSPNVLLGLF